jgi:hypothetical protein
MAHENWTMIAFGKRRKNGVYSLTSSQLTQEIKTVVSWACLMQFTFMLVTFVTPKATLSYFSQAIQTKLYLAEKVELFVQKS